MSATSLFVEQRKLCGGPFGAVIYKGDECVAKSYNHVLIDNDPTAHAEVCAIREACRQLNDFDLSGCVLYTSCEPCPMCLMSAKRANIDKIYFAATRKDAADIGFRDDELYNLLREGVYATFIEDCRQKAVEVMSSWYEKFGVSGKY